MDGELRIAAYDRRTAYIHMVYMSSARKNLRLDFKKGNGRLGTRQIPSITKKTAADSKAKGKKPGSTLSLLG